MNKTLSLSHAALKQGRQVGILNSIIQCENLSDGWKLGKVEGLIEEENAFSSSIGDETRLQISRKYVWEISYWV